MRWYLLLFCSAIFFFSCKNNKKEKPEDVDVTFINSTAHHSLLFVRLAEMAQQQSGNAPLKAFSNRLAAQSQVLYDTLHNMVRNKSKVLYPKAISKAMQTEIEPLQQHSGADFDKQYIALVIKKLQQYLSDYEKEMEHGLEEDVVKWSSISVEKIKPFLAEAQQLAAQMN